VARFAALACVLVPWLASRRSPRAVINAIYWGTQRSPLGTDAAAHCAICGTWGQ